MRLGLDEQPPGAPALQVEITDDGVGLPSAPARGVGLSSMRERATEVGGTCMIERSTPGGTRVLARLPLARQGEAG